MHSTHFIYGYMASDIWLRTILIVRKETRCCHIGYFYRLTATVLLYAPSHRQGNTYHGLCYTSRGALADREIAQSVHPMKDRSDDPSHHERTLYLWATSHSHHWMGASRRRKEGNVLFNNGMGHTIKDNLNSKRENLLQQLHGPLFLISSNGYFICTIPQTGQHIPWPFYGYMVSDIW